MRATSLSSDEPSGSEQPPRPACDPSSRRRRDVRRLVVGVCVAAVAVPGLWVLLWDTEGQAQKTQRCSALMMMRYYVEKEAERLGYYPLTLEEVEDIRESFIPYGETDNLEYVAAGARYTVAANQLIFRETAARRYGFQTGWFEFRRAGWQFHTGDPPPQAAAAGGTEALPQ